MENVILLFILSLVIVNGSDLKNFDFSDLSQKQIFVLKLLDHVTEPNVDEDIANMAENFDLGGRLDSFNKIEHVKTFLTMKRSRMLTKGETFCLFCERHTEQAIIVFKVLYGARDFATFLVTSCWMRLNINEMLFLYSFSVALRHRSDCVGLYMPPIYELYPFTSINSVTLYKIAVTVMMSDTIKKKIEFVFEEELRQSNCPCNTQYLTEDIGLNSFYYNFYLDYPFWMTDEVYGLDINRRGELYIYLHKQLLARYRIDKQATGYDDDKAFDPTQNTDGVLETSITFHNGWTLRVRGLSTNKEKYGVLKDLEYLEFQMRDALFMGLFRTNDGTAIEIQKKEATEFLGRRIYGNIRRFNNNFKEDLEYISKNIFCYPLENMNGYEMPSSFLQYYETNIKDPMFFYLQNYFISLISKVQQKNVSYKREDLYFYGIDIKRMVVSPLNTFMDYHVFDASNIIHFGSSDSMGHKIYIKKKQLNHAPFNITLDVLSNRQEECVIRIFIAPKTETSGYTFTAGENFETFIDLDIFSYTMKQGNNTIVRQDYEFNNVFKAENFTRDIRAEIRNEFFNVSKYHNSFTGFPSNLILPRGSENGLRFEMFVIITPIYPKYFREIKVEQFQRKRLCRYSLCVDDRPLGYPFDRNWENGVNLYPNMKLMDVVVGHKH